MLEEQEMRSVRWYFFGSGLGRRSELVLTAMITQLLQSDLHSSEILGDTPHNTYKF